MATPWPKDQTWPSPYREHATELSRYLQTALKSIDNANGHPIEPKGIRSAFIGTLTLLAKLQHIPDISHVHEAVENLRVETKAANENATRTTSSLRIAIQQNTAEITQNTNTSKDTNATAKEALKVGELTAKMVRDIKALGPMNQGSAAQSYASVAARGGLVGSIHNPQNQRPNHVQTLREIIVNIRDPVTIASIRAMNPRSLKAHVDRAIEQSNNEHIRKLKTVSANQLKSGDLSIKTATATEREALRQFAEDWEHRIGTGAAVRIPTYGILAHGIRTSTMDMERFTELREELLQDNKAFIPTAEIKYIGWLTRSANTKSASSVIVEFSKAEDANRLIDEGLIWQGEVFQCERYDRQCRLRQCFRCHSYGHIGTQCKATTTCGYCAQEHATRECPTKSDADTPRKCAACHGEHEAWHGRCPTRMRELAKIKEAYRQRPRYHPEAKTSPTAKETEPQTGITTRPVLEPGPTQDTRPGRSRSPIKKKVQKRQKSTGGDTQHENNKNDENTITVAPEKPRPRRYNVRKSRDTVMATLLRDPRIDKYDIIAIQEPWKNPFNATTHHPAKDRFHLCYPSNREGGPARVCFFVNKKLDHSKWQFKEHSKDLCTLTIGSETDQGVKIAIHNIYNPQNQEEGEKTVLQQLRTALETNNHIEQIVVGDFNLHHELWGGSDIRTTDAGARELVELMDDSDLINQLPAGTITYKEGDYSSTIDLCLLTVGLIERLIKCGIEDEVNHDSDHLPIATSLDLTIAQLQPEERRNWKALDERVFIRAIKRELPPLRRPRTKSALDKYVQDITEALSIATEEAVPKKILSPKSRAGWSEECEEVLAETKRLRRRFYAEHTEQNWEEYIIARNKKGRTIRKALQKAHREAVETAAESPESLWRIAKWARTRQNQMPTVTPEIAKPGSNHTATTPEEKAELFRETFFPAPPEANLEDIQNATYRDQITLPPISENEVEEAIKKTAPRKAPGPDGITNRALQIAKPWISPHLARAFNQSLRIGYCPQHFRKSTTIVLRKPGKDNYTVPKAYRPIALLNTVGKIMDAIIAERLSYLAETYNLLPKNHMGGRRQRSTEHALHLIIDKIYEAWNTRQGMAASLLLLDVSGAFDNVSHQRLLHNLRKRRINESIVRWITSFLGNRQTQIHIDGYRSEPYTLTTGIPQGSPLSPILYLFYNADILDRCNQGQETLATGFIDDVAILAWAETTEETCRKLQDALDEAEDWATTHASVFAPEKFQLVHFTRARSRINTNTPLQSKWGEIHPKPTCKYLGLTMDAILRWKQHIDAIERKVSKTISAISSLGSSTWGVKTKEMRTIYQGVAIPQMMYACSAWSNSGWRGKGYTDRTLNRLKRLQARAARAMCGAFRATSAPALDVEMNLLPMEQRIWKHNIDTINRLGPPEQGCESTQNRRKRRRKKKQRLSPRHTIEQELHNKQGSNTRPSEQIPPFITPPWWQGPRIYIADTAETAAKEHQTSLDIENEALHIYTDGSGINGHIGAAAVCHTTRQTRSSYMGDDATSTVYAGELRGIILALEIAEEDKRKGNNRSKILIYTDNQAAIRSSAKPKGKSGSYLLKTIADKTQKLQEHGLKTEIRWVPAHTGIQGNEDADIAAKEATGWRQNGQTGTKADTPKELYALRSTLKTWTHREANKTWQAEWSRETRGRTTHRHTPKPTKKVLQLHSGLSKRQSSILVQMRTEKIGLRDFLFNRRVPDATDANCQCREGRQTVSHVLLRCRRFRQLRRQELGAIPGRHNLRVVLNERKAAAKAIRFMEQTEILGQFRIESQPRQS
nr:zinc knuckle [Colletotrichum truncatum]KAF6790285.1 zinc knuckle [Colletotrichum truncatum]